MKASLSFKELPTAILSIVIFCFFVVQKINHEVIEKQILIVFGIILGKQ
jgi:hypothetical protein